MDWWFDIRHFNSPGISPKYKDLIAWMDEKWLEVELNALLRMDSSGDPVIEAKLKLVKAKYYTEKWVGEKVVGRVWKIITN